MTCRPLTCYRSYNKMKKVNFAAQNLHLGMMQKEPCSRQITKVLLPEVLTQKSAANSLKKWIPGPLLGYRVQI